jgi:hypothetical protein
MDHEEIGCDNVDKSCLIQDSVRCRVFVNTTLNYATVELHKKNPATCTRYLGVIKGLCYQQLRTL